MIKHNEVSNSLSGVWRCIILRALGSWFWSRMSYLWGPRLTVTIRISADVRHILLIGPQEQDAWTLPNGERTFSLLHWWTDVLQLIWRYRKAFHSNSEQEKVHLRKILVELLCQELILVHRQSRSHHLRLLELFVSQSNTSTCQRYSACYIAKQVSTSALAILMEPL